MTIYTVSCMSADVSGMETLEEARLEALRLVCEHNDGELGVSAKIYCGDGTFDYKECVETLVLFNGDYQDNEDA